MPFTIFSEANCNHFKINVVFALHKPEMHLFKYSKTDMLKAISKQFKILIEPAIGSCLQMYD